MHQQLQLNALQILDSTKHVFDCILQVRTAENLWCIFRGPMQFSSVSSGPWWWPQNLRCFLLLHISTFSCIQIQTDGIAPTCNISSICSVDILPHAAATLAKYHRWKVLPKPNDVETVINVRYRYRTSYISSVSIILSVQYRKLLSTCSFIIDEYRVYHCVNENGVVLWFYESLHLICIYLNQSKNHWSKARQPKRQERVEASEKNAHPGLWLSPFCVQCFCCSCLFLCCAAISCFISSWFSQVAIVLIFHHLCCDLIEM